MKLQYWCWMLIVTTGAWAASTAKAQSSGQVEITQADISRFPEVTVYFKVVDEWGQRLPTVLAKDVRAFEDGVEVEIAEFRGFGDFQTKTVLVIDTSDSMNESSGRQSKMNAAKDACTAFLQVCRPTDQVGLIEFNTRVSTLCPLGTPLDEIRSRANALLARDMTALHEGIHASLDLLRGSSGRRTVLLLSDGRNTVDPGHSFEEALQLADQLQVPVHSVGLGAGQDIDIPKLTELASRTGGRFLHMPTADKLVELYQSMGQSVQDELSIQFRSHRPSPDGTRRSLRIEVATATGTLAGNEQVLEPHLLNVRSHFGIFLLFLGALSVAYAVPFTRDRQQEQRRKLSRESAFAKLAPRSNLLPPQIRLDTQTHPTSLPVDQVERICTISVEVRAAIPAGVLPPCQPLCVIVLLDLSASMAGERLAAAKHALISLVGRLNSDDSFCLIGFSSEARVLVPFTGVQWLKSDIATLLKDLRTGTLTNLAPALELLLAELPPATDWGHRKLNVLLVSDGKVDDAAKAQLVRDRLPQAIQFAAFGIGVHYDCDLLALLCGGKDRVEHLESAAESTAEFSRFLHLFGHTLTSNARLRWRLEPCVSLRRIQSRRTGYEIPILNQEVSVDDLAPNEAVTVFVDFTFIPSQAGRHQLGELTLIVDLPGYGLSDQTFSQRIEMEVSADPNQVNANPMIASGERIMQTTRRLAVLEQQVAQGQVQEAIQEMTRITERLFAQGESSAAQVVERLTKQLETTTDPEQAKTRLRAVSNSTRRLTEGLSPPVETDTSSA